MSTKVDYMYRDGGNFKFPGEVVVANPDGLPAKQALKRLRAALQEGEFFIAEQLGLPRVFPWAQYDPCEETDHPWHTLNDLQAGCFPITLPGVTLKMLVERAEKAAKDGWLEYEAGGAPDPDKLKAFLAA